MKIKTRAARDPGGKVVDILPSEGSVNLILFVAGQDTTREALSARVASLLRELAASGKPKLSDRDFPIWFIDVPERPEIPALTGIALPARLASKVFLWFRDPLGRLDAFWTSEQGELEHLRSEPLLRYSHKLVIAYVDPMAGPTEGRPDGVDELRSADVPARVPRRTSEPTAGPNVQAAALHTVSSWAQTSSKMEAWIEDLWSPVSYASLRGSIENELGISVHDEPDAAAVGKYGCIRTGWLLGDDACTVRILLAPHHHDDLKYAILAHELGHYCRHFPLLHHAQLVEELSWAVPEVRLLYDLLVDWKLDAARLSLEDDANVFASSLLLPPRFLPAAEWASGFFQRDRPLRAEEVIFNGLQPLFPGKREQFAAMSLDEMRAAAGEQVARGDLASADDDSIYLGMLRGCIAREDGDAAQREVDVAEAIASVVEIHMRHVQTWWDETSGEPGSGRAWWQRVLLELDVDQIALPPTDLDAELRAGGRKAVVPPLNWDGVSLYPCIPLVPTIYNLDGDPDGDWRSLIDDDQPPGTIDEWLGAWDGRGMALYRLESWQRERVLRFPRI